jgi:hypothetical protein
VPRGAQDAFDLRLPHQQLPHTMTVEITMFLRRRLEGRDSGLMIVTVIPVALAWPSAQEGATENLRKFVSSYLQGKQLQSNRAVALC